MKNVRNAEEKRKFIIKSMRDIFKETRIEDAKLYSDKLMIEEEQKKYPFPIKKINKSSPYGINGRIIKFVPKIYRISKINLVVNKFNRLMNSKNYPFRAININNNIRIVHKECPIIHNQ